MIEIVIPGFAKDELLLEHVVLDFNGTLAIDGRLISGVKERLNILSGKLQVHILTGNTFHTAEQELRDISCKLTLLPEIDQAFEKGKYVSLLNKEAVIAIGNGRNDASMLQLAAIGIAVIQQEGAFSGIMERADIVCTHISDALDLLLHPLRLKATLRG